MSKHKVADHELNGAEFDVFCKLYRAGPQEDGDLPSKSGMCGLLGKGLSEITNKEKRNRLTLKGVEVAKRHFSARQG